MQENCYSGTHDCKKGQSAWASGQAARADGTALGNSMAADGAETQRAGAVCVAMRRHINNDALADMARSAGAIVNVLDRTDACDFITPAIVDRDPVVVAIGTEGSAPVLARQIKAESGRHAGDYGQRTRFGGDGIRTQTQSVV